LVEQIDTIKKAKRAGRPANNYPDGKGIKEAIRSGSTAPKNPRRKITDAHRRIIIRMRKERFTKRMGAQKLKVYADLAISHQSINKILKEEGLTAF